MDEIIYQEMGYRPQFANTITLVYDPGEGGEEPMALEVTLSDGKRRIQRRVALTAEDVGQLKGILESFELRGAVCESVLLDAGLNSLKVGGVQAIALSWQSLPEGWTGPARLVDALWGIAERAGVDRYWSWYGKPL